MRRIALALLLALSLAGCSSQQVSNEQLPPAFTYAFVVDGRVVKTFSVPAGVERVSAVVQPRNGESPIWQNHGASYAYVILEPRESDVTPTGGVAVDVRGMVEYYRDLKSERVDGMDEVVRGKPVDQEDMEEQTVTVEPNAPMNVRVVEGISVLITILPKQPAAAPAAGQ